MTSTFITQRGAARPCFPSFNGAEFSVDRVHRFLLWRIWDEQTPPLGFIMLNPSVADETRDDPTTVRNMTRARALGYGGVVQANLYSFRTPSPRALKQAGYPCATANWGHLQHLARACDDVVLAWGAHAPLVRAYEVVGTLRESAGRPRLLHLGLLKNGAPRHPLHTAYAVMLQEWQE